MYPVTSSLESIPKCVLLHLSYFVYFFWKGFSFDHWHLFYACATTIHSSISVANEIFFFLLFSLFCLLSFFQAKMTGETKFCERVLISQLFTCGSFFHVEYFFFLFFFFFFRTKWKMPFIIFAFLKTGSCRPWSDSFPNVRI